MKKFLPPLSVLSVLMAAAEVSLAAQPAEKPTAAPNDYQYADTRQLVRLVDDAATLLNTKGTAAFMDFRVPGSVWRQDEQYIFVLDRHGTMLVHPDKDLEGKNQFGLKDISGKPIVQQLIECVTTSPAKAAGWYHYQWPVPGEILPRWKSTYVRLVPTAAGESYIVGCGIYNDRMERSFVVDTVKDAVANIEKNGSAAFPMFRDPSSRFIAKDAYIFIVDKQGVELVNPAFRNLEGRNILDVKDSQGKELVRDMLNVVKKNDSGWVDYLWPKPGDSVPTLKSAFVSKANLSNSWVLVGCGVYLADAPKKMATTKTMTAPELMSLVRDGASLFEQRGEKAYPEFRQKGSKWLHDGTYIFVWTLDGIRVFHGGNPASEGTNASGLTDVLGRPVGKMFLATAATPSGEGWIHYLYPEPGNIFPIWKSTFIKRVTSPSGQRCLIGCGIYNIEMDPVFTEDVVNRAAALIAERGKDGFAALRDKTGPYLFLDTYVFVNTPDGVEVVNAAQPTLEGKNLMPLKDVNGKFVAREYIDVAMKNGSGWVDYYWYRPGQNTPTRKHTYVRKVQHGDETYIVGSGYYIDDADVAVGGIQKRSWKSVRAENLSEHLSRQTVSGQKATLAQFSAQKGTMVGRHSHNSEEYLWVTSGALKVAIGEREIETRAGEVLIIPSNTPHSIAALADATFVDFFTPLREDWQRGEDQYLRK